MVGRIDSDIPKLGKTIPKTFRIKEGILDEIVRRSNEYKISANQLVNQWLAKCLVLDPLWLHLNALTISQKSFSRVLEQVDKNKLEQIGNEMGRTIAPHLFTLFNVTPDWTSIYYALENAYSNACNWFKLKHYNTKGTQRIICEHNLGLNWSYFLKGYLGSMLKSLINIEPKIEVDSYIVKITAKNQMNF